MNYVGLNYEEMKDRSPFELSGGQKRRVAIAGVLAMRPKILILDEPTAGLDPKGRDEILNQIVKLHKENSDMTLMVVSHSMEDMAKLVDRLIVFSKGKIFKDGNPKEIFSDINSLESVGLGVPQITSCMEVLKKQGFDIKGTVLTVEDAKRQIIDIIKEKTNV